MDSEKLNIVFDLDNVIVEPLQYDDNIIWSKWNFAISFLILTEKNNNIMALYEIVWNLN
jgi:hypothetical protein